MTRHTDVAVASSAQRLLAQCVRSASLDAAVESDAPDSWGFRCGRRLDSWISSVRVWLALRDRYRVKPLNSAAILLTARVLSTSATAVLVIYGSLRGAVGVLALRLLVSTLAGPHVQELPYKRNARPRQEMLTVLDCLASHLGDATLLLSCGWVLSNSGRPVWGWALAAAAAIALLATVTRLAVLQLGLPLRRLQLERAFRNLSVVALCWAAFAQPRIATAAMPPLALVGMGPLVYSFLEMTRSVLWLRWLSRKEAARDRMATEEPARGPVLVLDYFGGLHRAVGA
jgi:hypothetical protein